MLGHDALDEALKGTSQGSEDRLVNIVNRVRSRGGVVFDTSFQHTNCMEKEGQTLGYATEGPIQLKGASKQHLQKSMRELDHVGPLFCQHGTILLCRGEALLLSRLGVNAVQETVTAG